MSAGSRSARRLRGYWQRLRTVPGLGRDVAALAGVVVVGLVAAMIIVENQIGRLPWQSPEQTVHVEFANAVAVNPTKNQQVRIAGVPVGTITDARATDHNSSVLTLELDNAEPVYDNAHATLRPTNPLNEMYVDLRPGSPPGKPLGDRILPAARTSTPTQLDQALGHLDVRARNALTNLLADSTTALRGADKTLPAGLQSTDATLRSLQPVVAALQTRRTKIQTLVTSLSQISTAVGNNDSRLSHLVDSTEQTLGVLDDKKTPLGESLRQLPQFSADLRSALSKTSGLTGQLNPLLDNLSQAANRLPSSLRGLTTFADKLGQTVPKAAPVVHKARPVVADARPVVTSLQGSLTDLRPVTRQLDPATGKLVRYLDGVAAFVYNTSSLTAASDTNGTMVRGQLTLNPLQPLGFGPHGCAPLPSYLPCLPGGQR
ncbi:MlaD family protein [Sciscionella marina]|uniref:MlaD family protein n=1 Tax=Sciscionella marina TaxID=508770 RepID=UPI0003A240E5|nr:MlaD family protein [Sciscionella marina]